MARRTRRDDEKAATKSVGVEKSEAEAANEAAIKEAEAAAAAAKEEETKQEAAAVIPDGVCDPDLWGHVDPGSNCCKKCPVFELCMAQTKAAATSKAASAATPKVRAPRVAGNGEFSKFGHCRANSQAGLIEKALETPKTIAELEKETGCTSSRIKSHIGWLVKNHSATCKKVVDGGKLHFELIKPAA